MTDDDHDHEHHHHDHDHDHDDVEVDFDADLAAQEEAEQRARRQIAISQIRQYGDPVLRMRANEVETFDDELEMLANRMFLLMHEADGVGLAATQIGIVKRVFVFNNEGEDVAVVNPVLAKTGRDVEVDTEGCLSLGPVRMPVERSVDVTLEGVAIDGTPMRLELEGTSARVVQHELDHLDGKLIIDRTDPEARREAMAQLRPRLVLSR
ncbi:MAG: peptide deformylase [Thermoleophilia bacterium]|nr:peptide deformylase [Thermoleophilia bacterium]